MWRPEDEVLAHVRHEGSRRRRRRRMIGGAAAALATASVLGLSLLLAPSDPAPRKLHSVGLPPVSTATVPTSVPGQPTATTVERLSGPVGTVPRAKPTARIAYVVSGEGTEEIHTVDPSGRNDRVAVRDGQAPSWSPDHTKLAFIRTKMDGGSELYVADADGSHERLVAGESDAPSSPAWSPDGREIAFMGMPMASPIGDGGTSLVPQIAVVQVDGSRPRPLTHDASQFSNPTWSPDGRRLAFIRTDLSGTDAPDRMQIVNADGTGLVTLPTQMRRAWCPSWSPDGRTIALSLDSGTGNTVVTQIYVMQTDGSGPRPLTSGTGVNACGAWSPDGRQMAFASSRDFPPPQPSGDGSRLPAIPTSIYVMNADGSSPHRVTQGPGHTGPAWR